MSIRPVLDPARTDAVDAHYPLTWLRELVILRERHCAIAGCTVDARACDLNYLAPYAPLDDDGLLGQTNPQNLGVPVSAQAISVAPGDDQKVPGRGTSTPSTVRSVRSA